MKDNTSRLQRMLQSFKATPFVLFVTLHSRRLSLAVLILFFVLFGYYITTHPAVLSNVVRIGPLKGMIVLILYFGVILTNFGIMYATIKMCKKQLPAKSGLLLTMYSSVVNFFGPLQSGPAVRAVYLKTKIGLRIRDYTYAMLFYYFAFAALNASLLFVNNLAWLTVLGIVATIILIVIASRRLGFGRLFRYVIAIFALTLAQIIVMITIYTIELYTIDPSAHYSLFQTIGYSASANLSLFVSLTPGGIGIREAFLIFSQSLHHIQLSAIVAAGVLDRALYVVFLLIVFVLSSGLHLKQTFARQQRP